MRKTTKIVTGGSSTIRVKGNITTNVGGTTRIYAKEGIEINSNGSINYYAPEYSYNDYTPREEIFTSHPTVEKVEFFDENNKLLNQNTKDFFYGKKLKLKVTTNEAKDGAIIFVKLQGKTKSKNQPFDLMTPNKNYNWWAKPVVNNQFETPLFELNPNWYSDDFEYYDYTNHETKINEDDLNEFFAEVRFDGKTVYLPLAGERLKPISYKRNYEELIGLFNNLGTKDLLDNYENKFIDKKIKGFKKIVDSFSEYLCEDNRDLTIDQIEAEVLKCAKKLWSKAVLTNQGYELKAKTKDLKTGKEKIAITHVPAILDDRPLYWSRIAMQVILKRHSAFYDDIKTLSKNDQDEFFIKSIVPKKSRLWKIIQLFEEQSRNYTNIDFSKAGTKKKVLITGFDPFQLNPYYAFSGPKTFNPSGIVALFLNKNQDLLSQNIYIQTCVFPVRYEDFDNECVENVIRKYINDVDLIITTSLNGGNNWFDIEQNAIEYRGGGSDNMFIGSDIEIIDGNRVENNIKRFLTNKNTTYNYTTLPQDRIFGKNNFSTIINNLVVKYDINKSNTEGAGSNYLSNEVMYRATKVRGLNSSKPVGHFHLANLININRIDEILKVTAEVIKKIIL